MGQTSTVRGFVTAAESGEGLIGASVLLTDGEGSQVEATTTGEKGFYRMSNIASGQYVLTISFVGFKTYRDTIQLLSDKSRIESASLRSKTKKLEGVTVEAEGGAGRIEAGKQEVQAADISRIPTPSPSGDVVSYLQSLPGVVSVGDRGGQLYVRGGTPSQNLVLMDGNLIYDPFHLVGFYSVFSEDLVSSADFYAGGFGAEYSDRISSVLDVTMRPGNKESYKASASVSPFVGQLRMEGPITDEGFSFIVSGRQSVIEGTSPVYLSTDIPLFFRDLYVKLHDTGENSQCGLTGLTTSDRGEIDPKDGESISYSNQALSGRCALTLPGSSALTIVRSGVSQYENSIGGTENPARTASISRGYIHFDLTVPYENLEFSYGARAKLNSFSYDVGSDFGVIDAEEDFFLTAGSYVEFEFSVPDWLSLNPSASFVWPTQYSPRLEPRLRAQATPFGDETRINAAVGLYQQTLSGISDERDAGNVFTAWRPSPIEDRQPQATHAILGVEQKIGSRFDLTIEGYSKWIENIIVPKFSALSRFTTETTLADGVSYGADLRLEYNHSRLYGFVGYGLSVTEYRSPRSDFGEFLGTSTEEYSPPHDQRHRVNAVLEYKSSFITANISWQFSSGLPYTRLVGIDSVIDLRELRENADSAPGRPRFVYDQPYNSRLPVYHRLDVSLARSFDIGRSALEMQLGAINTYDRRNVFYVDLFEQRRVDQLPVVPYFGIKLSSK